MSRITIISDAWHPQINGVVRSIDETNRALTEIGHQIIMITPLEFHAFPCPTYPEIRLSLVSPWKIAKLIKASQPDYIHIATEGPIGLMARRWCRKNERAFSTSYHTRFPEYVAARFPVPLTALYAFMRWFHNGGNSCMVATGSLEQELSAKGFRNLRRWSRGINLERFYPREKTPKPFGMQRPMFISIGRVAPEKNLEDFLRLDLPGSKVVVGDGPSRAELQAKYPNVHFTGTLQGDELAKAYSEADVFVFPSKTDTFGNVILEALACGVPVAAYPVTGPIDILGNHEKAGALRHDLRQAALSALECDAEAAIALAQSYTWDNASKQFFSALSAAAQTARVQAADESEDLDGLEGLQA